MEKVADKLETVHGFWPRYRAHSIILTITAAIIATAGIVALLLIAGIGAYTQPHFWLVVAGIFLLLLALHILVLASVMRPVRYMVAALNQSTGDRSPLTPPNPNDKQFARNGLKPVLQHIYELGNAHDGEAASTITDTSQQLQTALDEAVAGVVLLDEDRNIIFHNKAAPIRYDATKTPQLQLEFDDDETIDSWLKNNEKKSLRAERLWSRVASAPVGHKERKIYDISVSYRKGSTAAAIIICIDKTDTYSPEDEELNFIAFAAHELRGPITVIRGYLDTLNDELLSSISSEQQELFDRLIVSANRLSSYINNILNSSRYDRRHFNVHLSETNVADIYATVVDDLQLRASSQHRLLHVDLPRELPTVAADTSSVGEVFVNLIDNAIKYSSEGGPINVSAEQHGDMVEVSVQDHGIGMPANVVGNLFHKFYRSHRSRESVAGTGIGLYISKAIVESHGGTMEVSSVEGEGSRFMFSLPIYATVADKLAGQGDNNQELISNHSGSWIKNHGSFRG